MLNNKTSSNNKQLTLKATEDHVKLCACHCQAPPTPGRATGGDFSPKFVSRVGAFAQSLYKH